MRYGYANVTMHPFRQAIWGNVRKCTVEKSKTNATNVNMHPYRQAIWRNIWKCTVEKSKTNATNVTVHPLRQAIQLNLIKVTYENPQRWQTKQQTNQCEYIYLCGQPVQCQSWLLVVMAKYCSLNNLDWYYDWYTSEINKKTPTSVHTQYKTKTHRNLKSFKFLKRQTVLFSLGIRLETTFDITHVLVKSQVFNS